MQIQKPIVSQNKIIAEQQNINFGKFSIFLLIKTAHNNYGIKNTDYQRYRKYCSRKVQKIRKSLSVKLGNKTKFIKKDIIKQKNNDNKILQIALFNSQKYWAQSNQTKFSSQRKVSQKSRARFFSIKKLKKAIHWSSKLCNICSQKTDYSTKLQSNAYKYYLQGMLSFEKQQWNQAQVKLIAARQIMADIKKKSDSLSQSIFKQKIDQIDQTIKFCNFKISKGKDMPVSEIIQMKKLGDGSLSSLIENLTQQRLTQISLEQSAHNNKQITFGSQRYPVKQQKILIQKTKIDSELKTLEQIKKNSFNRLQDQQLYEQLLTFYSNIVVLIQQSIKITDQQRQDGKKNEKYTQGQLQILKKISILFQKLKITIFIDRNFTIFKHSYNTNKGRKSSPQTLSKLLTATINNFSTLDQVIREKVSISTSTLQQQIQSIEQKIFYLRTLRLLFVGQVYFNNQKIKQAFNLWNQCQRCLHTLISKEQMKNQKQKLSEEKQFIKCDLVGLDKIQNQLKQFKLKAIIQNYKNQNQQKKEVNKMLGDMNIKGDNNSQNVNVTLESIVNEKSQNTLVTLEKMSEIDIIDLSGNLQLLPTRPIFFDIFETQINYPTLQGKIKQNTGGWGGWFKKVFK